MGGLGVESSQTDPLALRKWRMGRWPAVTKWRSFDFPSDTKASVTNISAAINSEMTRFKSSRSTCGSDEVASLNYEDPASRWRRGRPLSTEPSYGPGFRFEMKRPPPIYFKV